MSRTVTRPRTSTRVRAAVVAVALVGGSALAGAGGAMAVASTTPPPPVELGSEADGLRFDLITDDALYVHVNNPGYSNAIYRRPLTSDGSGTTLGAATFVGRAAEYTSIAEHEGTLAYLRAADRRLVLRAPDGTETLPTWGANADFPNGPTALTGRWVVGGADTDVSVYNRETGQQLDLRTLSEIPPEVDEYTDIYAAAVTDDRALWVVRTRIDPPGYNALLTVALDEDGAAGPVTTLDVVNQSVSRYPPLGRPGVVGDMLLWFRFIDPGGTGTYTEQLRWDPAAPYGGEPSLASIDGQTSHALYTGTQVVLVRYAGVDEFGPPAFAVEWRDLSAPAATVRTSGTIVGSFSGVRDSLVAYGTGEGEMTYWLVDVDGLPITADGTVALPAPSFTDVQPGATFADEILWLADHGITTGYPDGTFRGTGSVNRGAMAAFLFRMYRMANPGTDAPDCTEAPFTDVPAAHPFCAEITWLVGTGITTGYPDGTFRPSQPVTRGAMAAFLYRFANGTDPAPGCASAPFTDVTMANPFCGEITWLADTGITTGWPDGTFRPGNPIARQAIAAFLFRFDTLGLVPGPK